MNPENRPSIEELFPLPKGTKLLTRKFGVNPPMTLTAVRPGKQGERLHLRWQDTTLGLTVEMTEDQVSGKLIAEAVCTDPALMGKAYAAVALHGQHEFEMIRKRIKIDQPDARTGGCRGSAEFGSLNAAVEKLGANLGLAVFMLV